ncbi:ABC transporter ATP-binding protein [Zhihengliuella sp.]|uniref:ABC transporter ATP-binding protein n=1 Tax=Zhihengliuella sp. TaxID=1954483 RepID=UPI0028115B60|nr:ABC transporter ATP-binding protein [Zhihengliuella sp.]
MNAPGTEPLVDVAGLTVRFGAGEPVVRGLDLRVAAGECVAIVGESGSGKSVTARALLGLADSGAAGPGGRARVHTDRLRIRGRDLRGATAAEWRRVRGGEVGLVLQDALVSLDPLRTVGRHLDDVLRLHTDLGPANRALRARELLADVGLSPATADQRAEQLSGGMRQRALIATAIAAGPGLLIADEPTTALDATVAARVMDLLARLRRPSATRPGGTGLLLISHDLAVVSSVADRILVMRDGEVVESGPAAQVLGSPQHEYTRLLLAAVPAGKPRGTRLTVTEPAPQSPSGPSPMRSAPAPSVPSSGRMPPAPALSARGLTKTFLRDGAPFAAVDGVGFELPAGRTVGLVGESGSGKTTTARLVLGLAEPDAGEVSLFGERWVGPGLRERDRRPRRAQLGAVYQDPLSSFDPRADVGALLADAATGGRSRNARRHRERIRELLDVVGLPEGVAARHPRALSGGQRQRVAIARALAPGPRVIVCDEPVSALDVSVQAQILDLLDDLQERLGLSYLFISHDLAVVRHVSDHLLVMQGGRIVESGPAEDVFADPRQEYTRQLLAASPTLEG